MNALTQSNVKILKRKDGDENFMKLPKKCEVNKFIPKKVFYEKVGISSSIKDDFVNLVDRITWLYKLSPDTIGISKNEKVEEIEIFQIDLKEKKIPTTILKTITKGIPYKILFVLKYENELCYSVKVEDFYTSEWNKKLDFEYNAINLEIVFENIVKNIIGENDNNNSFKDIIETKNILNDLENKINNLKNKIKKEKQFNKKVELNKELNKLLSELEEIQCKD